MKGRWPIQFSRKGDSYLINNVSLLLFTKHFIRIKSLFGLISHNLNWNWANITFKVLNYRSIENEFKSIQTKYLIGPCSWKKKSNWINVRCLFELKWPRCGDKVTSHYSKIIEYQVWNITTTKTIIVLLTRKGTVEHTKVCVQSRDTSMISISQLCNFL